MSNANDFIIENGILTKNVGSFCGCSNLRNITMHPGVTIDGIIQVARWEPKLLEIADS